LERVRLIDIETETKIEKSDAAEIGTLNEQRKKWLAEISEYEAECVRNMEAAKGLLLAYIKQSEEWLESHTHFRRISASCCISNPTTIFKTRWRFKNGRFELIKIIPCHTRSISFLEVLANGNVACNFEDATIQIWNLETGLMVHRLCGHAIVTGFVLLI
jgi:hypothetical protein